MLEKQLNARDEVLGDKGNATPELPSLALV